jgi:hypothetical protein
MKIGKHDYEWRHGPQGRRLVKNREPLLPGEVRETEMTGESVQRTCGGVAYSPVWLMDTKRKINKGCKFFWSRRDRPWRRAIGEANGDLKTNLCSDTTRKVQYA